MFKIFFQWVLSWFGKTPDRREEQVTNTTYEDDITVEVTFYHPTNRIPRRFREEPKPPKEPTKVSSEDIRSWLSAVREYDNVRSSLFT